MRCLEHTEGQTVMDKQVLRTALNSLESGANFEIVSDKDDSWIIRIEDNNVARITSAQRDYVLRHKLGYDDADTDTKVSMDARTLEELKTAIRYLLIMPSISSNLDASTAEIIMGWSRHEDQLGCGCHTYKSANGQIHHVAKEPNHGCKSHQVWSPSTNFSATQDLFEKPFPCFDGRYLAITNVQTNFQTKAFPPGQSVIVTNKDIIQARTVISFRNTARSESFDIVDEKCVPPAAVCIAALKQVGLDI
jgi:hypothetical protein